MKEENIPSSASGSFFSSRRFRILGSVLVGLVLLYGVGFGVVLPSILQRHLPGLVSSATGTETTMGEVRCNPFSLSLVVTDVAVALPKTREVIFTAKQLSIDPGLSSILRLAPSLSALHIEEPAVYMVRRKDGTSPLLGFVEEQQAAAGHKAPPAGEEELFPLVLSNMSLAKGSIYFDDQMHDVTHHVGNINFFMPFTSTLPDDKKKVLMPQLNATFDGSPITVTGSTTPFDDSINTRFRLHLGQLSFEQFLPYIRSVTSLEPVRGAMTAEVVLDVQETKGQIGFDLSGSIYLNDIALRASGGEEVLLLETGIIDVGALMLEQSHIAFKEIYLGNPVVVVQRNKSGALNWEEYFAMPEQAPVPVPAPPVLPEKATATSHVPTSVTSPGASVAQESPLKTVAASDGGQPSHDSVANPAAQVSPVVKTSGEHVAVEEAAGKAVTEHAVVNAAAANNVPLGVPAAEKAALEKAEGETAAVDTATLEEPATPAVNPFLALEKVSIIDAKVVWRDATGASSFERTLYPLNIELRDMDSESGTEGFFSVTLGSNLSAERSKTEAFFAAALQARAKVKVPPHKEGTVTTALEPPAATAETSGRAENSAASGASAGGAGVPAQPDASAVSSTPAASLAAENPTSKEVPAKGITSTVLAQSAASAAPAQTDSSQVPAGAVAPVVDGAPVPSGVPAAPVIAAVPVADPKPSEPFGDIAVRGRLRLSPLLFDARINVHSFPLQHISYYTQVDGVSTQSGLLNIDTQCRVEETPKSLVVELDDGAVSLHGLAVEQPIAGGVAKAQLRHLLLRGMKIDPQKQLITIGRVYLEAPHIEVALLPPATDVPAAPGSGVQGAAKEAKGVTALASATSQEKTGAKTELQKKSTQKKSEESATSEKPFEVLIEKVEMKQGQVDVANQANTKASLNLTGVDLLALNISTRAGESMKLNASAIWNKTGKARLDGAGTVTPLQVKGNIDLDKVPVASVSPWLRNVSVLDVKSGTFSCSLTASVAEQGIAVKAERSVKRAASASRGTLPLAEQQSAASTKGVGIALAGKAEIFNVRLLEKKREVMSVDSVHFYGLRVNTAADTYDVGSLKVVNPAVTYTRYPHGLDTFVLAFDVSGERAAAAKAKFARTSRVTQIDQAIKQAEKQAGQQTFSSGAAAKGQKGPAVGAKPAVPPGSLPAMPQVALQKGIGQESLVGVGRLTINQLTVQDGRVRYHDESLPRKASVTVSNIALTATGITSGERKPATFAFSGKVEGAPLAGTITANPLFSPLQGNVALKLDGMDMEPLSPYAESFLSYPITKGALSVNTTLQTDGVAVTSQNKILLDSLVLGDLVPGQKAPGVPIKTGLSLLSDSKGRVSLDLPISGRLSDPSFHVGGIVANVLGNMFFSVVASPFTLLGNIVSGLGGESAPNLEFVQFAPGDDRLDAKGMATVKQVVALLQKRSKITLTLQGFVDEGERPLLVEATIKKGVQQAKWEELSAKEQAVTLPIALLVDKRGGAQEYADLLFAYYKTLDIPKEKVLGITKKIPVDAMEKTIANAIAVDDNALELLAVRRAEAIKAAVVQQDASLESRVVVAKTGKMREGGTGKAMISRVEFGVQ